MPASLPVVTVQEIRYTALPTLLLFHNDSTTHRCVVGPVGSGKTSAAAWEVCYYLPMFLADKYNIKKTRWAVVRNSYRELMDTTFKTVQDWFPFGHHAKADNIYTINMKRGIEVELLLRSCDRLDQVSKFKSMELTGYWCDESIEIIPEIKRMLKNRIGRYPKASEWPKNETGEYAVKKYGIETTNPPDVEHPTYYEFDWGDTPPPGPYPEKEPLKGHRGFWQPPRENTRNLAAGYYEDLKDAYRDNEDWADMYIEGKPGIIVKGKLIYNNFKRDYHVSKEPLKYSGGKLYRGWDNTGNTPAAVLGYIPTAGRIHILREFTTDRMGIVDFAKHVVEQTEALFPGAPEIVDYGDPAGNAEFSKKEGGFTSNAKLMEEATKIKVLPSEQNFDARTQAVEQALARIDGILFDKSCTRLINGFLGGYCWKMNDKGEPTDVVNKNRFSHCLDGSTLISAAGGQVEIKNINVGDMVITPRGEKRVTATMNSVSSDLLLISLSNGNKIICTKDHPFIINNDIVVADALLKNMALESINVNARENTAWGGQRKIISKSLMVLGFIKNLLVITRQSMKNMAGHTCTAMFGHIIMDQYQMVSASTILTKTNQITALKTLNQNRIVSMQFPTCVKTIKTTLNQCLRGLGQHNKKLKNGTDQMKVESGTKNTEGEHGRAGKKKKENAFFAAKSIWPYWEQLKKVFVPHIVNPKKEKCRELTTKKETASFVEMSLRLINTLKNKHAVRIVKISSLAEQRRVYDLTVEDAHCFYANGILVGNCHDALQYLLVKLVLSTSQQQGTSGWQPKRTGKIKKG